MGGPAGTKELSVGKIVTFSAENITIDLKDNVLAAFLAWLIPGLGHLYQRRLAQATLFFVLIMGTFVYGIYLGGSPEVGWGRVVYASWPPDEWRWYYFCQVGVGLPALPALVQANRVRSGGNPLFNSSFMAPPRRDGGGDGPTINDLHYKLNRFFELGTVYTMIAGLLNVLAIYDAWGGPVFIVPPRKEEDEPDAKRESAAAKSPDKSE
jgi:hypothetical protein